MKKIIVIGAGSWGSAIANLLAKNSNQVFLSSNRQNIIDEINQSGTNKAFLASIKLSKNITAISGFESQIKEAELVFIVTPSSSATEIFQKISESNPRKDCCFIICSKGVERKSLTLLSEAFENITNIKNYAVLSGPNFAIEVAQEVPTITTIATKNKNIADQISVVLDNEVFKTQYFEDPRSAEICAIVKNIIAIGCGIIDGLNLGANAKAALVMKGVSEIKILCKELNASQDIANSAGFGDIFLTCSSTKSRNNSLGCLIAKGQTYQEILEQTNNTYEGASSAAAIAEISKKYKLTLDLCGKINEILTNKYSPSQIKAIITKSILS